ncbi:MAG: hypothetical protein WBQ73_04060 [Candidatus Babeliales bacterium]
MNKFDAIIACFPEVVCVAKLYHDTDNLWTDVRLKLDRAIGPIVYGIDDQEKIYKASLNKNEQKILLCQNEI